MVEGHVVYVGIDKNHYPFAKCSCGYVKHQRYKSGTKPLTQEQLIKEHLSQV